MSAKRPQRPQPAKNLVGLVGYAPPKAPAPTDLLLDANEGPPPPPEFFRLFDRIDTDHVRRYIKAIELETVLADRFGVTPEQIMVGAGADEIIDRICRVYVQPDREVVVPTPTFEMICHFARISGGKIQRVVWSGEEFPLAGVQDAASERTGMVVVVSPNNPTGFIVRPEELAALAEAAPQAIIMVDLAYASFAEVDLLGTVLRYPNAVAVGTLSKGYGLAGLRLGFAIGDKEVVQLLRLTGGPYPVSSLSVAMATKWLVDGERQIAASIARIREEREALLHLLAGLGVETLSGQGNFVFARFADDLWVRDALAGLGIAVRYVSATEGFAAGLRISCPGAAEDFERLCHALVTVLSPEAILFDMDGVPGSTLIPDPEVLARLGARMRLGVVTARSRTEAERFLEEQGVRRHFAMLVCREDAPLESAAAGMRLALQKSGIFRAWFVSETTDGIRAARGAHVLPIGFSTPAGADDDSLYAAGAGRVGKSFAEIERLL